MMSQNRPRIFVLISCFVFLALIVVSCSAPDSIDIPQTEETIPTETAEVIIPTELPPAPKKLIVCAAREPQSLYLYAQGGREADTVFSAIYDGPIDVRSYEFQPVILEKLPGLEDGDAQLRDVPVTEGDLFLNPVTQLPELLKSGKPYLPPGCFSSVCSLTYSSGDVLMSRMEADFKLIEGITWSDGAPLTAADSVYSYTVDADFDTPSTKFLVQRTSSYNQLDALSVRWVGIPGFLDPEMASNFWSPLPQHQLGNFSAAELNDLELSTRQPLGWGPYVIDTWTPGEQIEFVRNESYFRASEGWPAFEFLTLRFLGQADESALQQALTGECDILDESLLTESLWPVMTELETAGRLQLAGVPGSLAERLDFNVSPRANTGIDARFADVRLRQAVGACIDREMLVDQLLFGQGQLMRSYLPADYPASQPDNPSILYSPAQARLDLDEVGWLDMDEDPSTPRTANGVVGVFDGAELTLKLVTTPGPLHEAVVAQLAENFEECGIGLEVNYQDPEILFAPWPDGPVFGAQFEMVLWTWPTFYTPGCEMFAGFEIPGEEYRYGVNASGFRDVTFDQLCQQIMLGASISPEYESWVSDSLSLFLEQLPAIPLFSRPRWLAAGNAICGLEPDPTVFSMLWNLEELQSDEACDT
jgi:peptide/nickel transport system substrate-binding protein